MDILKWELNNPRKLVVLLAFVISKLHFWGLISVKYGEANLLSLYRQRGFLVFNVV